MSKHAVILVGGKGTRLRPYTLVIPKPLVPLGDTPVLEIILRQLASAGFSSVTLATNHQSEIVAAFCGDGSKWNLDIQYSKETTPLGTMGPLKHMRDLPESFVVMNGDVLTDLDFGQFVDDHVASGNHFSIAATRREVKSDYGILECDNSSRLIGFEEKPSTQILVSMGVYGMSRSALQFVPENTPFGFDDLMYTFIDNKVFPRVVVHEGRWHDIGQPDDCERAGQDFMQNSNLFLPSA